MSYYQGDYYQGDGIGKRFGRWFRKKAAPVLRKYGPATLGFIPGVGVVGAGAISALTKSKQPNRTTADTLMRVLGGPNAAPEVKPLRAKGTAKRSAAAAPRRAAPARRPISPLQRSRGVTTGRARVMSPYRRNQLARARAAAARGRR